MTNILLVDDDQLFTDATAQLITLLGHNVEVAATAEQAKQKLENEHYDVLMLDIMLPDGRTVIEELENQQLLPAPKDGS